MEALDIVNKLGEKKRPYESTLYLLKRYRDLKNGKEIVQKPSAVLELLDKAIDMIKDDPFIDIIEYHYKRGYTAKKTSIEMNIDIATVYRNRKRLVERIAVILYGDKALL